MLSWYPTFTCVHLSNTPRPTHTSRRLVSVTLLLCSDIEMNTTSKAILPHLKNHFKVQKLFHSLYYTWDDRNQAVVASRYLDRTLHRFHITLSWIYLLLQCLKVFNSSTNVTGNVIPAIIIGLYFTGVVLGTKFGTDRADLQLFHVMFSSTSKEKCEGSKIILILD